MAPRLKVEVEPLTEQRWARLERSLFARLDAGAARPYDAPATSKFPLAWLAAAAVLGTLIFLLARGAIGADPSAADVTSRITTGTTGSHVALPGLSLDVQPHSVVVVGGEPDQARLIVLDRGSVALNVAPRPKDAPLIIQAGAARVRVIGTRFSVSREGDSARVAVTDGVVEVSVAGRSWRVAAGQVWPATESAPVTAAPPADADAAEERQAPDTVVPEVASSKQVAPHKRPPSSAPSKEIGPQDAGAKPDAPSGQALFEQATALERAEPTRALAIYGALENGSDSWAPNALYAHGRLLAARGRKIEARRLLERYLTRYPRGTNADDARALLDRLR